MDLKWLPNALTVLRCALAVLVGWSILKLNVTLEQLLEAISAQDALSVAAKLGEDIEGLAPVAEFNRWSIWLPFVLFTTVAATDFIDGYLARKLDAMSAFGAFLDPIADKLLVGISLLGVCLMQDWSLVWLVPTVIIIGRDVMITSLRIIRPDARSVSRLAKWKTALEMLAIGLFLLVFALPVWAEFAFGNDLKRWMQDLEPASSVMHIVSLGCLYLAAVAALMTGYQYVRTALTRPGD